MRVDCNLKRNFNTAVFVICLQFTLSFYIIICCDLKFEILGKVTLSKSSAMICRQPTVLDDSFCFDLPRADQMPISVHMVFVSLYHLNWLFNFLTNQSAYYEQFINLPTQKFSLEDWVVFDKVLQRLYRGLSNFSLLNCKIIVDV